MNALVFGGEGAIGAAACSKLADERFAVLTSSRTPGSADLCIDPIAEPSTLTALDDLQPLGAVVWAQGANLNDSAHGVDVEALGQMIDANVTFIAATLAHLLSRELLAANASLVVVSSIWESIARPGKFSYSVSKAAVGGLVRAAAADLAADGHRVNAVLPGVTDTPMTRAMLDADQLGAVTSATGFGRLVSLDEVAATIAWLCSAQSSGINGQSLTVDLGFSNVRSI